MGESPEPPESDWLNAAEREQQEADRAKAKEFAQLYVGAFVRNPSGAALLAHWQKALLNAKRLNANSSHAQFAWEEARRVFVLEILENIDLASKP